MDESAPQPAASQQTGPMEEPPAGSDLFVVQTGPNTYTLSLTGPSTASLVYTDTPAPTLTLESDPNAAGAVRAVLLPDNRIILY